MSGDILGCLCYWHIVGRNQGCSHSPYMRRTAPRTESYLAPNARAPWLGNPRQDRGSVRLGTPRTAQSRSTLSACRLTNQLGTESSYIRKESTTSISQGRYPSASPYYVITATRADDSYYWRHIPTLCCLTFPLQGCLQCAFCVTSQQGCRDRS